MLPRWAYGFWQSRQRYTTQAELLGVVAEYRKRKIPLDNIVHGLVLLEGGRLGLARVRQERVSPIRRRMIDKVHAQNAHFMISVWPKFYPGTANYKELDAAGFMYRGNIEAGALDWVGPGYTIVVLRSVFQGRARHLLAPDQREAQRARRRRLVDGRHRAGPALQSRHRFDQGAHRPDGDGSGGAITSTPIRWCTPAASTKARAQRSPDKRVFILTRSGFAGIQRNAAAVWSGDIASRWDDLYNQISAGVSIGYSGLPNWTFDIGGFANEGALQHQQAGRGRSRGMARAQPALVPVRRVRAAVPLARRVPVPRDLQPRAARLRGLRQPGVARQAALPPAAVHLHGGRRHLSTATAPSCAASPWTSPTTRRRATCAMSTCSARPSWWRRCTSTRRARARSIYRPAPTGTTSTRARSRPAARRSRRRRRSARMPLYVRAGSIVPVGPDDPVHRREARRADHAVRVHRRRRQLRLLRRRRRELRLRAWRVRAYPAALRRGQGHADHRRALGQLSRACPRSARSRCAGSRRAAKRRPTWMRPRIRPVEYNGAEVTSQ